ncbi:inositol monophosphatase family protein [Salipiger marinus]|uniref:inositol monophosphatase family protein n=1 Tax=Salipiger marinus TaxID=555512 RepID=UPI0040589841
MTDSTMGHALFLHTLIRDAGGLALQHFNSRPAGFALKGPQDPVTEADLAVEQFIRSRVAAAFPDDGFLGEESGASGGENVWVVDPIDGTDNFARGIPHFCVSIAYVVNAQTRLGAIFNPCTSELYLAEKGRGATKNGLRLAVSENPPACSAVELGWSSRVSRSAYTAALHRLLDAGANVRRHGSGALALAWVAEGRTDGYAELHMNSWDALAGLLMVREAGGVTTEGADSGERLFKGGAVFAANLLLAPLMTEHSDAEAVFTG